MSGTAFGNCTSVYPHSQSVEFSGAISVESREGEEPAPAQGSGAYVPFSERDPRRKLDEVLRGAKTVEREDAEDTELPLLTRISGWVVAAFTALSVLLGISRAIKRPEVSSEPDPASKQELPKGKLFDAEHLKDYEAGKRARIIEAWKSLPDKYKIAAIEDEMRGVSIKDGEAIPQSPPRVWATGIALIMDSQAERRNDLTTSQGMLDEAKLHELHGKEYGRLYLYEKAANSAMAAGRVFESYGRSNPEAGAGGVLVSALNAYRSAGVYAGLAGKTIMQNTADREAERIWIKTKLIEKLSQGDYLAGEKTDVNALSEVLSRRAVEEPFFGNKFLVRRSSDGPRDGFAFPAVDGKGFDRTISEVKAELALGLAPNWRAGVEKFFYATEEPMYLELQKWHLYSEITKEAVVDFAPLVLKALSDSEFRSKYLTKEGMVSHEGLQAVRAAENLRISSMPSEKIVERVARPFEKEAGKVVDDPVKAKFYEKVLDRWHGQEGNIRLVAVALREDEAVVEIGPHDEMIPVKWIFDNFSEDEVTEEIRRLRDAGGAALELENVLPKLMADKELKRYIESLSKPEREAFLKEQVKEHGRIGGKQEFAPWLKKRINVLTQAEMAEMARELDERMRDKKARRERKDRSRQSLMENTKKGRVKGK